MCSKDEFFKVDIAPLKCIYASLLIIGYTPPICYFMYECSVWIPIIIVCVTIQFFKVDPWQLSQSLAFVQLKTPGATLDPCNSRVLVCMRTRLHMCVRARSCICMHEYVYVLYVFCLLMLSVMYACSCSSPF